MVRQALTIPDRDAPAIDWALWYAELGWPVLPLRGKVPVTEHGVHDASTNPSLIAAKWTLHPGLNVGLATGVIFDVLDVDSTEALQDFAAREQHSGPRSRTGKKGYHLLYLPTGRPNDTFLRGINLDWRGTNGYIVAPPSVHPETGVRYEWQRPPTTPLGHAPDWLFEGVPAPDPGRKGKLDPNDHNRVPYYHNRTASFIAYTYAPLDVLLNANVPVWRNGKDKWKTNCLWADARHDDRKPSLVIYPRSFYCFGCGRYGGSPDLLLVLGLANDHFVRIMRDEAERKGEVAS